MKAELRSLRFFEYKEYQITGILELNRSQLSSLLKLYGTDPVELFWSELRDQANKIVKMIDDNNEYLKGATAISLRLGETKQEWIVEKAVQGINIDEYVKPTNGKSSHGSRLKKRR